MVFIGLFVAAAGLAAAYSGPALTAAALILGTIFGVYSLVRPNEVTLLTIFVVLLFGIPANLIVGPVGSIGTPANLLCMGFLLLWVLLKIDNGTDMGFGPQPLRYVVLLFIIASTLSYVAGQLRGLTAEEASGADSALIALTVLAGLLLFAADTIRSRAALDKVLRRLTMGGAFMSFIGVLQFLGTNLVESISIPGLVIADKDATTTMARGTFDRVAGTGLHPIEFAVVLALLFPVALHYALHAPRERVVTRWAVVALIGIGIPLALSRSGVVVLAVAGGITAVTWSLRRLGNALIIGAVALMALQAVVPGLLGSIKALFANADEDPSVAGRTDDYARVFEYFRERPWLGRGPGTFIPPRYDILDNDHLYVLVTMGIIGLAASIGLYVVGASLARGARKRATDEETRHLGQTLAGSIVAAMVAGATFDSGGFQIMFGTTYLLIGCAAALWRLQSAVSADPTGPERTTKPDQSRPSQRYDQHLGGALRSNRGSTA